MSAKSHLFLLLVVSTLGIIFALIPATEAETSFEITEITHLNSEIENQINVTINNSYQKEVSYTLSINIFSKELQNNIITNKSNEFLSIEAENSQTVTFNFTIPYSGEHLFNFTLSSNEEEEIKIFYKEYNYSFYKNEIIDISNIIVDYYPDDNGVTKWQYNNYDKRIELIMLDESYNTAIILGPFNTSKKINNKLQIENNFLKSNTANYSISYTSEFDNQQLYRTKWNSLYTIDSTTENKISLNLIESSEIYIKLSASDITGNETNYWDVTEIILKYITAKHDLIISTDKHYFYDVDKTPEIFISLENKGTLNQKLGNISVIVNLYYENIYLDAYSKSLSLQVDQTQTLNFRFLNLVDPGNYYCKIKTTIINEEIFLSQINSFISFSTKDLGSFELNFSENNGNLSISSESNSLNLLIESDDINSLKFGDNNYTIHLLERYYLVKITNIDNNLIIESNLLGFHGTIISTIIMDEYKFRAYSEENIVETIEGINAPTLYFERPKEYYANIIIENQGFHKEEYKLSYLFASTFVHSVEGPTAININAGETAYLQIKINPLNMIPRQGGSQLNIEISNQDETEIITYVLSYQNTDISILEHTCDRQALLLTQSVTCSTVVTNLGYTSGDLNIKIGSQIDTEKQIIESIDIGKLNNGELWTFITTYSPEKEGKYKIFIDVSDNKGIITSYEMNEYINVIQSNEEIQEPILSFKLPMINLNSALLTFSLLGIGYQFRRSENFKYLTFKFFIPLYSRLQKDTLADEPTRQSLLQHIYSTPGSNFTQLKERFDLHNGTLAHHINILENHNMITSHRSGRQRLFFPYGRISQMVTRTSLITNKTQKEIVDIVKTNPGITQSMISQRLAVSRQKINYHVNSLASKSYLKIEKQGRITRIYPTHFT